MTAEELLTVNPLLAVKMAAADLVGKPAIPDWFVIRSIRTSSLIQEAQITLEMNELFVPYPYRSKITQPIEMTINKIDLSLLSTNGPIDLKVSSIFHDKSYVELLTEKYSHVNLIIVQDDIKELTPLPSDTTITASERSVRWYGKADVRIELVIENISKFIKRSTLVIDHTPDYNEGTVLNDLVSALNRVNLTELPLPVSTSTVEFLDGVPTVETNEVDKTNTSIVLKFSYPYSGTHTVFYNRRDFHRTFTNPVNIKAFGDLSMEGLLGVINETLKSDISLSELEDFDIPKVVELGETRLVEGRYMLSIKETSIAHYGDIWFTLERDYVE